MSGPLSLRSPHWLLIFDDATRPEILRAYIPQGRGHVIVTSRITEWRQVLSTDGIEVKQFPRADTVRFLRDRVPELAYGADGPEEARREDVANQLSEILGDLPLVAEHAASYITQTGTPASEYIEAFKRNAYDVTNLGADMFSTTAAVATTWNVSRHSLSPEARDLFQLLAFFAPEPVSEELLTQPGLAMSAADLPGPLHKVLSSRAELKRAERELARFSLVSIYGARNVIQMHRVVQAVTRGRIENETLPLATVLRDTVFALLAASDPEAPEKEQNDPIYERSIRHLEPTGALESDNERLRNLIINQVRRLRLRGAFRESLSLGENALKVWRAEPDSLQTLALAVEIAVAMRMIGRVDEAFELNSDTIARLREHHEDSDVYLICANSYGEDLRRRGRFDEALAHDLGLLPAFERVFDPGQYRTLSLRNNIAIDMRCVGRFEDALEYDTQNAAERERYFGATDWQTISSKFGMARDYRRLGRYDEALALGRELTELMEARNEPWNFLRLDVYAGLSVALRRIGYYPEAHDLAEGVYRRYLEFAGEDHRATLVMATNLVCDRRVVDDLAGAQDLGETTVANWEKVAGPDHPNTLTARGNLAVVLRMRGSLAAARTMNESVLAGFRASFPRYDHPSTLVVMTNLASDLAAVGEVKQARELGEKALKSSRKSRGPAHPATLALAANLSLDLRATGDLAAAQALSEEALAAYDARLTGEHPQALRAHQQGRVNVDIEPMSP
jgi:tetratricopeptide (TPR) repeat protein